MIGHGFLADTEPQVPCGSARPDFLLSCTDANVPPVAIFTDGHAYHVGVGEGADSTGVLAEDARKRRDLSDAGYLVLAVTAEDLRPDPPPPGWYHQAAWPLLVRQAPTVVPLRDGLAQGPVAFLRWWLTDPDPARQRALADVLPYLLGAGRTPFALDARQPLTEPAVEVQDGRQPAAGTATGLGWRRGPLTVLARIVTADGAAARPEIAAVLDDRPETLTDPELPAAWRDWLRLANGLQRHTIALQVTTRRLLAEAVPVVAAPTAPKRAGLDLAWQVAWDVMLDEAGRSLVASLAAAGVEPPDRVGEELGPSAIPADLIWDGSRVAVLIQPDPDDAAELALEGWTVISADVDAITAAVEEGSRRR